MRLRVACLTAGSYALPIILSVAVSAALRAETERVLLPIVVSASPGANGSIWTSDVQYRTDSEFTHVSPVRIADWEPPSRTTIQLPVFLAGPKDLPGQFIYVDRRAAAQTHISVRVRDLTRPASGVDLPGVREEEFTSSPLEFLNVPIVPDSFVLLRVYEADAKPGDSVTVRILRTTQDGRDELITTASLCPASAGT